MKHYRISGKTIKIGTMVELSEFLAVSRQYLHRCYSEDRLCKGFSVSYSHTTHSRKHTTKLEQLREARHLLLRAKLIIDEKNAHLNNNGEYANINIISDIERFLSKEKQ